jgi:hypothetical protein
MYLSCSLFMILDFSPRHLTNFLVSVRHEDQCIESVRGLISKIVTSRAILQKYPTLL